MFTIEDFKDRLECPYEIVNFRRISVKPDNISTPSKIVEQKFLSLKLPKKLSIYKVIYDVSPSIRPPVLCLHCLRFGHTQKFCCGKQPCDHRGNFDHNINACNIRLISPPTCIKYKLDHLPSNRSCVEWSTQKQTKRITATENMSYIEAIQLQRFGFVNKTFTYANISNPNNNKYVTLPLPCKISASLNLLIQSPILLFLFSLTLLKKKGK